MEAGSDGNLPAAHLSQGRSQCGLRLGSPESLTSISTLHSPLTPSAPATLMGLQFPTPARRAPTPGPLHLRSHGLKHLHSAYPHLSFLTFKPVPMPPSWGSSMTTHCRFCPLFTLLHKILNYLTSSVSPSQWRPLSLDTHSVPRTVPGTSINNCGMSTFIEHLLYTGQVWVGMGHQEEQERWPDPLGP